MSVSLISTRDSYGRSLVELGTQHNDVVVLDADLAVSTRTIHFRQHFPERHINCGIAECNMMSIAAGLASTGMVPFATTFAIFAAGRAYEQIRTSVVYPRLNVKIGATHAGTSGAEDGATHQCYEDIALMRSLPGMVVIQPADERETRAAVQAAYEYNGPVYLRLSSREVPIINTRQDYFFEIGKGIVLRDGTDVAIMATGICVCEALKAADFLEQSGISTCVVNIHTIKPLDETLILSLARKVQRIVTVEDHSVIGGLGSAVAELLSEKCPIPLKRLGIMDSFGESGTEQDLIMKYGLEYLKISQSVYEFLDGCGNICVRDSENQ